MLGTVDHKGEKTVFCVLRTSQELFPSILSPGNTSLLTVSQRCHIFSCHCGTVLPS